MRDRFGTQLHLIYVGGRNPETLGKFTDVLAELELPSDLPVHFEEGDPAEAILAALARENIDEPWPVRWRRRSCYIHFWVMSHVAWCERRTVQ